MLRLGQSTLTDQHSAEHELKFARRKERWLIFLFFGLFVFVVFFCSADAISNLSLEFDTKEQAIAYAETQGRLCLNNIPFHYNKFSFAV